MIHHAIQLSHILFDANAQGMIRCDRFGKLLDANTRFLQMLGYDSLQELLNTNCNHTPAHWQTIERDIIHEQVLPTGISMKYQKEYYHQDGSLVYVEQMLWSTPNEQNDRMIWGFVRNLSNEKYIQQKLAVLIDTIEKNHRQRNQILEKECKWLAAEVHDSIGQQLTAISLELGLLRNRTANDEQVNTHIASIMSLTNESLHNVRSICKELRPIEHLSHNGIEAIRGYSKKWEARTGIRTDIVHNLEYLGYPLNTVCYRIVQEALTNVSRHAKATHVQIDIAQNSQTIQLTLHDNGVGIPPEALDDPGSLGLVGMKERTESAGGQLHIIANKGTLISAVFDRQKLKYT